VTVEVDIITPEARTFITATNTAKKISRAELGEGAISTVVAPKN